MTKQTAAQVAPEATLERMLARQSTQTTEDCLFLDVVVPKKIFDTGISNDGSRGAEVVV